MENQTPAAGENQTPAVGENLPPAAGVEWTSTMVYILGVICLVLGIALGALFHGPVAAPVSAASDPQIPAGAGQMPSMPANGNPHAMSANMPKDPVIEKVKSDPNNFDLLVQAGNAEMKANDPKSAIDYYERALKAKDDQETRINLANADFRSGDPDQSLAELATVLKADPKNDKALYNTGVVKLMAKNDPKGAIAVWETFLKYHPDHPRKDQVLEMIKRVKSAAVKSQG